MAEHPTSRAGPAPPLQKKSESSPEEKLKEVEQQVNALLEQSAFAAVRQEKPSSLARFYPVSQYLLRARASSARAPWVLTSPLARKAHMARY